MKLIDNVAGIAPLIIGPSPRRHKMSKQYVRIEDSLIVGMSPGFECYKDGVRYCIFNFSVQNYLLLTI